MSHFEFDVLGQLAEPLLEAMRSRFGEVTTHRAGRGTTVSVDGLDAASERALLTLLWDTGHDVVSTRSHR